MSKPSDAAQRAEERTFVIDEAMADKINRIRELREQIQKLETECAGLAVEKATMFWVINGDKPEPPTSTGKRKDTRKAKMTDPGATDEVPVVRAKAKEQKDQEAFITGHHYCNDCASNVAVTVKIVKGEEVTTCRECGSLQVEPLI